MNNTQKITKLQDAISDMETIDNLLVAGSIDEAQQELFNLWRVATSILGGNEKVRELLDRFNQEFATRYTKINTPASLKRWQRETE